MAKNQIVREFFRKFDEIQYDIDGHHWLFAVVVFFLGYQLLVAWSLIDLRDGLLAGAAGQQKIYRDILSLQEQVTSLRADLANIQRNGMRQNVTFEQPPKVVVNPNRSPAATDADPIKGDADTSASREKRRH